MMTNLVAHSFIRSSAHSSRSMQTTEKILYSSPQILSDLSRFFGTDHEEKFLRFSSRSHFSTSPREGRFLVGLTSDRLKLRRNKQKNTVNISLRINIFNERAIEE